jgi:UDP-N-acetylmuramoyl-L-alanyl-D-glutamate--2,6-diaminopimelate ligase
LRADVLLRELILTKEIKRRLARIEIREIVTDPLKAAADCVFVCTRTAMRDGHYGAFDAYSRGCRVFVARRGLGLPESAVVLVTENTDIALAKLSAELYGPLPRRMRILGITGTHGKSAVTLLTAEILRQSGATVAVLTGDGSDDGHRFSAAEAIVPDAAEVWRFLYRSAQNGAKYAVLEFSAYMLAQQTAYGIPFTATLLTDLTPHHIGAGMHRSFEAYCAAKALLFRAPAKRAFLPAALSREMGTAISVTVYDQGGTIRLEDEGTSVAGETYGRRLRMRAKGVDTVLFHPVLGDFACQNALCAATLAEAVGLSPVRIAEALTRAWPIGRLELVASREGRRIYLDVAYTGEELERVLRILRESSSGRLAVLLGSVGGRARERRAALGAAAGRMADFTYFTSDDPAGEPPDEILADMTVDWPRLARYEFIKDRAAAIQAAVAALRVGDTLLILGKAQDPTQLTAEGVCYFSDRDIADAALFV